jgi:hypothetical protein
VASLYAYTHLAEQPVVLLNLHVVCAAHDVAEVNVWQASTHTKFEESHMHVADFALQLAFVVYAEAQRLPQRPVAAFQAQPVEPPHWAVVVRMLH